MKPFARYGESNLAWSERRSANLLDNGEHNMDSAMHAYFDRISRDANNVGSGCNINYFNLFKKLFMAGDVVYRIKHHKHPRIAQQL